MNKVGLEPTILGVGTSAPVSWSGQTLIYQRDKFEEGRAFMLQYFSVWQNGREGDLASWFSLSLNRPKTSDRALYLDNYMNKERSKTWIKTIRACL